MAVTRTSAGTMASGLGAITPTFGAGAAAGDFGILVVETAKQGVAAPSGWTEISSSITVGFGTAGAAGASKLQIFKKNSITSGDISSGISIADGGDHQNAVLMTYSGVDTSVTYTLGDGISGSTEQSTATTSVASSALGSTNGKNNGIILAIIATDRDSNTVSTNTSPSWGGITGSNSFIVNGSSSTGTGGGIIVNELVANADATAGMTFSCSITSSAHSVVLVSMKPSVTAINGTLSKTLGTLTSSSNGQLLLQATLSKTLGTVTSSSQGKLLLKASLSQTLGAATLAAANGHVATLSVTLGSLTPSSAGKLLLKATVSKTLGTLTGSETGQLLLKATLTKTLGTATLASQANLRLSGSLSKTLGVLTGVSAGKLLLKGSSSGTLGSLTSASLGQVILKASVNITLGGLSGSETGQLLLRGSLSSNLSSLALSSTGQLVSVSLRTGSLTIVLDTLTSSSTTRLFNRVNVTMKGGFRTSLADQLRRPKFRSYSPQIRQT